MTYPRIDHAARNNGLPAGRAAAFDDFLLEPEEDDYLDRCLFELGETPADYRNL